MTNVYVFDADTNAPIEGATVTCTGLPSQETGADGYASFDTAPFSYYTFMAYTDHYIEPSSQYVMGADPYIEFGLHRLISPYEFWPLYAFEGNEYPLPGTIVHVDDVSGTTPSKTCTPTWYQVGYVCTLMLGSGISYSAWTEKTGYKEMTPIAFTGEYYGWLALTLTPRLPTVTTEEASLIKCTTTQLNGLLTDLDGLANVGFHFHYWGGGLDEYTHIGHPTGPSSHASVVTGLQPDTTYSYQAIGINDSDPDAIVFHSYGVTKQFTTLKEEPAIITHTLLTVYLFDSAEWPLENVTITVTDSETGGALYNESCTSYYISVMHAYGCPFELSEGVEYTARAERAGYHTLTTTFVATDDGDTTLASVPRMPTVTTEAASLIKSTSAQLNGLLTDLDGLANVGFHFHYWGGGLDEYTHIGHPTGPSSHASVVTGLQPDTTYSYQAIGINDSDPDAIVFHSYGVTKQFTTTIGETPPSGVYTIGENYVNVCGAEIANNCITVDVFVEHFGSDSECNVYLEYWSEGDTEHNFTDPITVPYDPEYEEYGGFELQGVTSCISDCERDFHVRAVASNSVGSNHSETVTPITVRLEPVECVTETTATLRASILSTGTVSSGVWMFRYGTPTPNTWTTVTPISEAGPLSASIHELEPNTTYQYSLLARNTYGYPQTWSGTMSFTTLGAPQTSWEFNIDGNAEGWSPISDLTSFTISEGTLKTTATGHDPYMRSSTRLSVDGSMFKYVILNMRVSTGTFGQIFFITESDQIWTESKSRWFTIIPGEAFRTYSIDMSSIPEWADGTIRQIRVDPPPYSGNIEFDFIRLSEIRLTYDLTFIATAPGISDLHNVDITDTTDPLNHIYLGKT